MKGNGNNCPFKPGDRLWGYGRDSGGDEQQESVPSQQRHIAEYCAHHHLQLVHFFADEARVGTTTDGRVALWDLLHLARQDPRPVEGVIFWSFSRLARNQEDAQFIRADLRRRGYVVHSMQDDVPSGEFAHIVEALIDWKNVRFVEDLKRDVRRGLHDVAKAGYVPGGRAPVGYMRQEVVVGLTRDGRPHVLSQWVPDPEVAPRVQLAFAMRARGASVRSIHEATRLLGAFGSYATMFRNTSYLGTCKCGELELPNHHEAIVDLATWDAVQQFIETNPRPGARVPRARLHPRRAGGTYLLSGLAFCPECGAGMVCGTDNVNGHGRAPWRFYMCGRKKREGWDSCPTGKIGAEAAEVAILEIVMQRILTPEFVQTVATKMNEALTQSVRDAFELQVREAERQLAEVQKGIAALLDLAERYGASSAGERLIEREAERASLQAELRRLEFQRKNQEIVVTPELIESLLAPMHEVMAGNDVRAKRQVLSKVLVRVEMGRKEGTLTYTFPLYDATGIYAVPPREFESLSPP